MLLMVEFPHTEEVWNKVVVDSTEDIYVDSEDSDTFTVEYRSYDAMASAVLRFNGMVDYTIKKITCMSELEVDFINQCYRGVREFEVVREFQND